jgi:beta-aspartyl-peptidase (threonine type)
MGTFTLVIHGGAGTIRRESMSSEKEAVYRKALNEALCAGFKILKEGGTSLDAVRKSVVTLEDDDLFNAGRGSVYAADKTQEMDASIMNGLTLEAGSVAAVRNVRNPIELAYTIMKKSEHVMLHGKGAFEFAKMHGLKTEPDEYFRSEMRLEQLRRAQEKGVTLLDHDSTLGTHSEKKFGTVGAVACDMHGNIAAATSTGGMTNKEYGRIGDGPIIGAGTYANNKTCAISCTGHGEPFMRAVTAYDVSCLMEYKGHTLQEAMAIVVHDKLVKIYQGEGGMIGVDTNGNGAMIFNSDGMYRGLKSSDGRDEIGIYK